MDHPNIATVYDIGRSDDAGLYIAMAYYDGETLTAWIRRAPVSIEQARDIALQLAEGLRTAHAKGIVHRDIKPANIALTSEGVAKIVDFGVAKPVGRVAPTAGMAAGTVAYMRPEQTLGEEVDARSDIWALGAVLYEMLAGDRPFKGDGPTSVISAIRRHEPEPIVRIRPDVSPSLARIIARCLAKNPDARFPDAAALVAALRIGDGSEPAKTATRRRVIGATAAAVIAAAIGIAVTPPARSSSHRANCAHPRTGSRYCRCARQETIRPTSISPPA